MLLKTQSRAGRKVFSFLMIDNGDKLDNLDNLAGSPPFLIQFLRAQIVESKANADVGIKMSNLLPAAAAAAPEFSARSFLERPGDIKHYC